MSATDWSICPKCRATTLASRNNAMAEVDSLYGVIPAEEYIERRALAMQPIKLDETLREDYNGVGVDEDGVFSIHYYASCERCTFSYKFEASEIAFTPSPREEQ